MFVSNQQIRGRSALSTDSIARSRTRRAAVVTCGWGLMFFASMASAAQTDPITGHSCEEAVTGSFGSAQVFAILKPDGAISHYLLGWEMQPRRRGAWLSGRWALGSSPGVPSDDGEISVHFATDDDDVGEVRIEIWRGSEHPLSDMGFRGRYLHAYRTQTGAPFGTTSDALWGEIRAMLSGVDAVTVGVVRYRYAAIMARDRLDASVTDMPAAAVAAARDGLVARIADFHNRCSPMRASDGIP